MSMRSCLLFIEGGLLLEGELQNETGKLPFPSDT